MSQANPTDHEADVYAAEYVLTGDQSKAFRKAFPNSNAKPEVLWSKASTLFKNGKVQERIGKLQKEQAEKDKKEFDLSAEQIKKMLVETFQASIKEKVDRYGNAVPNAPAAAVSALAEINRMNGNHASTKTEITNPDGSLTPTIIERRIIKADDSTAD